MVRSCKGKKYFNSHPHEEDDHKPVHHLSQGEFQLTSSRRGWRYGRIESFMFETISTHILTKRMTDFPIPLAPIIVFQLTSSRRGWQKAKTLLRSRKHFNSHPHEEDDKNKNGDVRKSNISTHILTKRMTDRYIQLCYMFQYFNSHPHEEDDWTRRGRD